MVENDLANNLQDTFEADGALMGGTSGMRYGMLEGNLEKGYISVGTGISSNGTRDYERPYSSAYETDLKMVVEDIIISKKSFFFITIIG